MSGHAWTKEKDRILWWIDMLLAWCKASEKW